MHYKFYLGDSERLAICPHEVDNENRAITIERLTREPFGPSRISVHVSHVGHLKPSTVLLHLFWEPPVSRAIPLMPFELLKRWEVEIDREQERLDVAFAGNCVWRGTHDWQPEIEVVRSARQQYIRFIATLECDETRQAPSLDELATDPCVAVLNWFVPIHQDAHGA